LVDADDLQWPRRVARSESAFAFQPLTVNKQIVLTAELPANQSKRFFHRTMVFRSRKVAVGFVAKFRQ
jgi:hypothetical protein